MDKQVVRYTQIGPIEVGEGTFVVPVDHPSSLVINGQVARTSAVVFYDEERGVVETRNTIYVPLEVVDA